MLSCFSFLRLLLFTGIDVPFYIHTIVFIVILYECLVKEMNTYFFVDNSTKYCFNDLPRSLVVLHHVNTLHVDVLL